MPTIIDSLLVELSLDPTKFEKGQKQAAEAFIKTRDEAVKSGKQIEDAGNKSAESINKLAREVQGLFGLFLGGMGAMAIKSFVDQISKIDGALGRSAANLSMAPTQLGAWENAFLRLGSQAGSATSALSKLSSTMQGLKRGILPSTEYWQIQNLGGQHITDADTPEQAARKMSADLQAIAASKDPTWGGRRMALSLGQGFGLSEDQINAMLNPKLSRYIQEGRRDAISDRDVQAAQKLQDSWTHLSEAMSNLGTKIVTEIAPGIIEITDGLVHLVERITGIIPGIGKTVRNRDQQFSDMNAAGDVAGAPTPGITPEQAQAGSRTLSNAWNWTRRQFGYGPSTTPATTSTPSAAPAPAPSAPAPTPDSGGTSSNRRGAMMGYAVDQLRREGVPEANLRAAAAHLVGQADMESGLNPGLSHDSGTGYGIYGARLGRRARMFAWLEANGYARNSAEGQMRYMAHEAMGGAFPRTRNILMNADEAGLAANSWSITREFEAPAITNNRSGAVLRAYGAGASSAFPQTLRDEPTVVHSEIYSPAGQQNWLSRHHGAISAAHWRSASNTYNNSSNATHFNGNITVQTQATDAQGFASDLRPALDRSGFAAHANNGAQ